jgi:ribosomal protein S18 acetylase RimI-like enzyme
MLAIMGESEDHASGAATGAAAQIRRATLEDVPAIAALERELVRTDAPDDLYLVRTTSQQEAEAQTRRLVESSWGVSLVAEARGRTVGFLSGGIKDSPAWRPVRATEIHTIFVEEGFRGQGLGTQLVEAFVRWSQAHGVQAIDVGAFASNERAIAFYRRAGFRPTLVTLELQLPAGSPANDATPDS